MFGSVTGAGRRGMPRETARRSRHQRGICPITSASLPFQAHLDRVLVVHRHLHLRLEAPRAIAPSERRVVDDVRERHAGARMLAAGRSDRLREAVGERERLLVAARARVGAVARKHRLVEQMPAELDLLFASSDCRRELSEPGNHRGSRSAKNCDEGVDVAAICAATGHAATPTRIRPAASQPATPERMNIATAYGLLPVRRVVAEIADRGGERVALADPCVERVDRGGFDTRGLGAVFLDPRSSSLSSAHSTAVRSCTNRCMYACLASSRRFRPRYASARYSIASDDVGASVSARS